MASGTSANESFDATGAVARARNFLRLGESAKAQILLTQARGSARAHGDTAAECLAIAVSATLSMRAGDYESAAALGEEALLMAGPFTNPSASCEACLTLCMVYSEIGLVEDAIRMAEDARTFAQLANDQSLLSWAYTRIGDALLLKQILFGVPTLSRCIRNYGVARRIARKIGESEPLIAALNNLMRAVVETPKAGHDLVPAVTRRALRLALRAGELAMAELQRSGHEMARRVVEPNYGAILCKNGRFEQGRQTLNSVLQWRKDAHGVADNYTLLRLGMAEIAVGRVSEGVAHLKEALAIGSVTTDWPAVVMIRQKLSVIAKARGDLNETLNQFELLEYDRRRQFLAQEKMRLAIDSRLRHLREALWTAAQARVDAETDALTSVLNRRGFTVSLATAIALAQAQDRPYAIAMIDIDFFKNINDRYGHLVGDRVLKRVALALKENCRDKDLLGRYGGDEFVLGVAGASKEAFSARCEDLRVAVEQIDFETLGLSARVSISIGISDTSEASEMTSLLAVADQRLYDAKRGGRNRVER